MFFIRRWALDVQRSMFILEKHDKPNPNVVFLILPIDRFLTFWYQ